MPPETPLYSHARNHEDVVLWRALANICNGRFVLVGSHGTDHGSVTRALSERGWTEVDVGFTRSSREPTDQDVHLMVIEADGTGPGILDSLDLPALHPWVLVVAATAPGAAVRDNAGWEVGLLAAGYRLRLFDGVSRFYASDDCADDVQERLSYPVCALDSFVDAGTAGGWPERAELVSAVHRWRAEALTAWASTGESATVAQVQRAESERAAAAHEVAAMRATLSWRITRPIRWLHPVLRRIAGHA